MTSTAHLRLVPPPVSDADATLFETTRPRLLGIAQRVLGCPSEADDVVQEAWIRWQRTDRDQVRDATAFLATTTTRLAINVLQSAHSRRETAVGPRLVETADAAADPSLEAERAEALDAALGCLLARLGPAEAAAYVLREAFDYPYRRIAHVLGLSEANARQLVTRARRRLCGDDHRPVAASELRPLVEGFAAASRTGELAQLEQVLATHAGRAAFRVAA